MRRYDLASVLTEERTLTAEQIEQAKEEARQANLSLEQAITNLGFLSQQDLLEIKARSLEVRIVDLNRFPVSPEVATCLPENFARAHTLIPILRVDNTLTLAMADPLDINAIEQVEALTGNQVEIVLSNDLDINQTIEKIYGVFGKIEELIKQIDATPTLQELSKEKAVPIMRDAQADGPVAKIIQLIISRAVNLRASDIHLEPLEERLRMRFRIDGILQEAFHFDPKYYAALSSATKIMAAMDIAEKRLPQDGRFRIKVGSRDVDLRVASYPTMHGEKIVIRILDKEDAKLNLNDLGLQEKDYYELKNIVAKPHGIFLVTGPTGSGKTTTLYSVLTTITNQHLNVITLEDPIEYDLSSVNQGQVNSKAGLTFANGLRAILRQDPDIIMVGEIRDSETAEIATQAALTGHLVLSTLHTNDAAGAVTRLIDMGVEPFLVASSLEGVMAQRLVRRLCENCRQAYEPTVELMNRLNIREFAGCVFYKAAGCRECNRTGYRGRIGIFELMPISEDIQDYITHKKATSDIRDLAMEQGMQTMRMDGIQKAIAGVTSLEEVLRVVGN